MGNSGSIHNVAIGLDESQYPYHYHQQFQDQQQQNQLHGQHPLHWTPSYSSNSSGGGVGVGGQSLPSHVKVLPEPSKQSRLRPTTNGNILHSGGTISGRREAINNPVQLLQRSKTTLNDSPGNFRRTASGQYTERTIEHRRSAHPLPIPARRGEICEINSKTASKRFGSEPDLRNNVEEELNLNSTRNARLPSPSKSKIVKGKKKLATATPSLSTNENATPINSNLAQPQRKLRLFKTKAESRKTTDRPTSFHNTKFPPEVSDSPFRRFDSPDRSSASPHHYLPGKEEPGHKKREDPKPKSNPPVFRREKSFDITLLRNRNRDVEQSSENPVVVPTPVPPAKLSISRQRSVDVNELSKNMQTSTLNPKMNKSRKFSQPGLALETGRDFKKELEAATKRRSLVALENSERAYQGDDSSDLKKLQKNTSRQPVTTRILPKVPGNQKEPVKNQTQPAIGQDNKQRAVASKIPQLTKTFYFGMEKPSSKSHCNGEAETVSSNQKGDTDNFAKIQMDVIDQFAKSIFTTPEYQRTESESSESALSSEEGCHLMPRNEVASHDNDEENDNQIQVHIRPTLPRKQLEIPRFSPAAAWRMLNEDRFPVISQQSTSEIIPAETQLQASQSPQPIEGRIQRIYREPNPMYPDNKSGDSGISGDAGLPERADSPKNQRLTSNVGPFLTAWTPQQDLDEDEEDDDSSSDGDIGNGSKTGSSNKFTSRGHTFSLSLPRENQLSFYEEKDKSGFSSLQKLKRTVSGVFANQSNQMNNNRSSTNVRSDNWLLSRSEPNSIDNSQLSIPLGATNGQDSTNPSSNTLSYLTAGRHMMYLPNQPIDGCDENDFTNEPMSFNIPVTDQDVSNERSIDLQGSNGAQKKSRDNSESEIQESQAVTSTNVDETGGKPSRKSRGGHRFTFQSTVRQIERRRIADKLSKEAEHKEAQRISELEAMRRVEEEFQRKRAGEKASIRHQLRLFSLEESQCTSLPVDWQIQQSHQNNMPARDYSPPYHSQLQRAEPDGAVSSSPTSSPNLHSYSKTRMNSTEISNISTKAVETVSKTQQHYARKDEPILRSSSRPRQQQQPPPQTEVLTEFRSPRREYFEYRSASGSNYRKFEQTEHNEVVCNIPLTANTQPQRNDRCREPEVNMNDRRFLPEMPYHGSKKLSRFQPPSG